MTITLKKHGVRLEIKTTHHANHIMGVTFTWPDGTMTYGEYKTVGEAIEAAAAGRGKEA